MGTSRLNIQENDFGFLIEAPQFTACFGNAHSSIDLFKNSFPQFEFQKIRQTHSKIVVESRRTNPEIREADAHYSFDSGLGLAIFTADCVPVLMSSTDCVAAVHAGWRGVASRIIPETIRELQSRGVPANSLQVFIGPHIQQPSFEVGKDVRDQILNSLPRDLDRHDFYTGQPGDKSLVDLNAIVKCQLQEFTIPADQVFDLHIDTKSDRLWHSHRRDRETAGRNCSFITLK